MSQPEGYEISREKLEKYLLKPGAKHAREFFDAGYGPGDWERLGRDIGSLFDEALKTDAVIARNGAERFSIFMYLGIGVKKRFRTVWQRDTAEATPRFITAYREGEISCLR